MSNNTTDRDDDYYYTNDDGTPFDSIEQANAIMCHAHVFDEILAFKMKDGLYVGKVERTNAWGINSDYSYYLTDVERIGDNKPSPPLTEEGEKPKVGNTILYIPTNETGIVWNVLNDEYVQVDFSKGRFTNGKTAIKNCKIISKEGEKGLKCTPGEVLIKDFKDVGSRILASMVLENANRRDLSEALKQLLLRFDNFI